MLKTIKNLKFIALGLIFAFFINTIGPVGTVQAQDYALPTPGQMIHLSPVFNPPILKGIKVHPDDPFRFDFILDRGESQESSQAIKDESSKLIKYFMASLTVPEKDLWVNLSPYEKNRIIPQAFGQTGMGRDLLAEDYMLKQITASLIYPEDTIGKNFWKRVYEEAAKRFGTTNIPVNTFNKVWIVPEKAVVYENAKAGTAYVVESKLKVMLEQDYLALEKNSKYSSSLMGVGINTLGSQIVREVIIPQLTKEVNEDKNFSQLRQVYNSLILATWYKKKIKDSILAQVYENKNKIAGVNIDDPLEKQRIYERYLQAFKKGVYNYIKEEIDPVTQESIPRKYFSGGFGFTGIDGAMMTTTRMPRLLNQFMVLLKVGLELSKRLPEAVRYKKVNLTRVDVASFRQALFSGTLKPGVAKVTTVLNTLSSIASRLVKLDTVITVGGNHNRFALNLIPEYNELIHTPGLFEAVERILNIIYLGTEGRQLKQKDEIIRRKQ